MKKQAITLGRIGILGPIAAMLLFWLPIIGQLIPIAALVLIMISHYNFSKVYESSGIFKNILIGVIVGIVVSVIGSILLGIGIGTAAVTAADVQITDTQQIANLITESALTIIGGIIISLAMIIGYYLAYLSFKQLAEKTIINYFKIAGLLYFIGAIIMLVVTLFFISTLVVLAGILFFIGGLVMLAGYILHIIAYFTIQPDEEATPEQS